MDLLEKWKVLDAVETYGIRHWSKGYFGINKAGHVVVHPNKNPDESIDLKDLVDQLQARGIQLPILLRFTDILRHPRRRDSRSLSQRHSRVRLSRRLLLRLSIKVNQQRRRQKSSISVRLQFRPGSGSSRALAVLALDQWRRRHHLQWIQDDEFIKMTMMARKMGKQIIPVVEKFTELEVIVRHAQELKVKPVIGVRVKLASRGAGRWKSSAGYRSKFGLTITEVIEAFEFLKNCDMADSLQLVHFHLGSQITNIRNVKNALNEAARVFVEMSRISPSLRYLDVGGGLGIDYDGSQTISNRASTTHCKYAAT